jgi:hypothetical protein
MELGVTLAMAIYILPCLGICECELIRHGPEDRAIVQMELVDVKRPSTTEETPDTINLPASGRYKLLYP